MPNYNELDPSLENYMRESQFKKWYADYSSKMNLNPNPDDPEHFYDYRSAFFSGARPDESGHMPSQFKKPDHPRRMVGGLDTQDEKSGNLARLLGSWRFR